MLSAACKQIIRDGDRFPRPKEIRDAARTISDRVDAARTLANPNPSEPESFLARSRRVGGHDAVWHRAHHDLLQVHFDAHCEGRLTDEYLLHAIRAAEKWREVKPMLNPNMARAAE